MSLSRSANSNTDGILSLLNIDLKLVEEKYFSVILSSLYLIIMGLVSLLYLVYLSPLLAMLFIVCSFLPILPSIIFGPLLSNATVKFTKSSEDVITNINDFSQGIEEIRTYSAFPSFLERSEALIHDMERDYELLGNKHSFIGFSSAMLSWFSYLIPISIALFLVIKGDLDSTIVIAIFLASDRVISPFRSLSDSLRLIKSTEITRKKLCELIDNKNNIVSKTNLNRPDLYFENVSFSYDKDVISNISFFNTLR